YQDYSYYSAPSCGNCDDTCASEPGADDKVETRPIVASQAIGDKWLVTEGLKAGDRVVISGLQKVRPGVQVKAQEVTADNNQQAASGAQPEQSKS
ncbi:HlyD family secretion protein, partial [Escherichia coli]